MDINMSCTRLLRNYLGSFVYSVASSDSASAGLGQPLIITANTCIKSWVNPLTTTHVICVNSPETSMTKKNCHATPQPPISLSRNSAISENYSKTQELSIIICSSFFFLFLYSISGSFFNLRFVVWFIFTFQFPPDANISCRRWCCI